MFGADVLLQNKKKGGNPKLGRAQFKSKQSDNIIKCNGGKLSATRGGESPHINDIRKYLTETKEQKVESFRAKSTLKKGQILVKDVKSSDLHVSHVRKGETGSPRGP